MIHHRFHNAATYTLEFPFAMVLTVLPNISVLVSVWMETLFYGDHCDCIPSSSALTSSRRSVPRSLRHGGLFPETGDKGADSEPSRRRGLLDVYHDRAISECA